VCRFTAGRGRLRPCDGEAEVRAGGCVAISPGAPHKLWAGPDARLVLLCACAPLLWDEGTTMLEGPAERGAKPD
jgi:mannose-6-phosphate isomerase-like protein (cupin superfamily)